MSAIADELSRRASPRYIGEQVRERALDKTQQWKEDFISSPTALGLIGGLLGAAVGRAFARNRRESQFRRRGYGYYAYGDRYGYADRYGADLRYRGDFAYPGQRESGESSYRDSDGGVREKIAGGAQELKDRAGEMVSEVRERIPTMSELGDKAEENPALIALGGLALGAVAALLLPVTRKERELLEPVKQRASEAISSVGEQIAGSAQQAQEKVAGRSEQQSTAVAYPSTPNEPPLTH